MYSTPDNKFLDRSSGRRATDKYHKVAVDKLEEIRRMESQKGGIGRIASSGFELAEETRAKVAQVLHCKPRNVFFANSATMAAIPILLAFLSFKKAEIDHVLEEYKSDSSNQGREKARELRREYKLTGEIVPSPISLSEPYITFPNLVSAYPSILLGLFGHERYDLNAKQSSILTRQNFGYRAVGFDALLFAIRSYFSVLGKDLGLTKNRWDILASCDFLKCFRTKFKADYPSPKNERMVAIIEAADRLLWKAYSEEALSFLKAEAIEKISRPPKSPFVFLDGSHTFGVIDQNIPLLCDAFVANSSKGLGAEPTIGIGYVSDELLEIMERVLPTTLYPRIGFQFSPETSLGIESRFIEKMDSSWISLPELASMNVALDTLLAEGIENRTKQLFKIRTKLLEGLKRLGFVELSPDDGRFWDTTFENPDSLQEKLLEKLGDVAFQELPNCVGVTGPYSAIDLVRFLEERKYILGRMNTDLFCPRQLTGEPGREVEFRMRHALRISFRHDTEQDVDGFLLAVEAAISSDPKVDKYRRAAERLKADLPELKILSAWPLDKWNKNKRAVRIFYEAFGMYEKIYEDPESFLNALKEVLKNESFS